MGAASNAAAEAGLPLLPGLLHPDRWLLWLGLLFIASVYFFPTGVVGRLRNPSRKPSEGHGGPYFYGSYPAPLNLR